MKIADKYLKKVTVQEYANKEKIAGVEILVSNWFSTTDGNLAEILRYDSGQIQGIAQDFVLRQINWSFVTPGAIKGYHYHQHQKDVWFCPPYDRLIVNLHDLREDSPTFDQHQTLVLGAGKNMILVIPEGVAHGCSNPYEKPATLFYVVNQQFDPANPDEQRLSWNTWGEDIWMVEKG
jgi:dTDP-4-dehydrorhamnose 3,5-epimerase